MSRSVAVASSPVFSPSTTSLFKSTQSPQETLTLTLTLLKQSPSPSLSPAQSSPSPSSSSLSPSFRIRLQKPPPTSAAATLLNRKRPARLDIPVVATASAPGFGGGCGGGVPAAEVVEEEDVVEREGFGYSVYCKKGKRIALEDRFSAFVDLQSDSKQALFGVFDGHGGPKAAEFAARNLDKNILDEVGTTIREEEGGVVDAVKRGYLKTDALFLKEDLCGGSCCVTAMIRKGNLIVSNAGDCRAVLSRSGVAEALTSDHRPSREDEKDRIETLGGYVDLIRGVWRVQGTLAVSRGIGDGHLKQWITAEPETKMIRLEPEYEFLILASDGLWDKVGNQEAVDIAHRLCMGVDRPDPLSACKKLADLSVSRGSYDDISVMLIQLGRFV